MRLRIRKLLIALVLAYIGLTALALLDVLATELAVGIAVIGTAGAIFGWFARGYAEYIDPAVEVVADPYPYRNRDTRRD